METINPNSCSEHLTCTVLCIETQFCVHIGTLATINGLSGMWGYQVRGHSLAQTTNFPSFTDTINPQKPLPG